MIKAWSLFPLVLVLAACTQTQSREVVNNDAGAAGYPARLPLADISLAVEQAPVQPEGAAWSSPNGEARFGVPGGAELLAISCDHAPNGAAFVKITRNTRAEQGAKALFAVIGNGRIARLPLDAVRGGDAGEWRGLIPAADPRLDVLKGGNRLEGTLPGGGTLRMTASSAPGRILAACRASDRSPEPRPAFYY